MSWTMKLWKVVSFVCQITTSDSGTEGVKQWGYKPYDAQIDFERSEWIH